MARLVLGIDARPARQGAQDFDRSAQRVTRSAREAAGATDRVGNSFQRLRPAVQAATGAFAALGGALAIRQLVRYADVATQLNSRLRLVTDTSEELADIQRDLFNLSQETRTGLQNTTNLYVRLQQALQGTGIEQERVFQVTEAFNKALQLSGSTTAEASAATVQFSQAIAGSVVRAEEFNSLIDASPRLIRALINELEGVDDVGALRQLLEDGELTRERVIEALTNALPRLRGEFEELDRTTSQAFTQLNNALITAIGNIDDQAGATNALNDAIDSIREVVSDPQFQQAAANLTSNLVTISQLSLGNLPEIVKQYERLANALSFLGDFGLSPTGLPSLDLSNLGVGSGGSGGSSGSSQDQTGTRITIPPGPEPAPAPGTKPPIGTPGTKPSDVARQFQQQQTEARRAFAREQIQRVNLTSDLIAGQREELREQAERLRADLNPALAEYQERVQNIEASSAFLTQAEKAELLKNAYERLNERTNEFQEETRFLEQIGDRAFDRIGSAITQMAVEGEDAFSSLRNVGNAVISELMQAFIQLAAINPLKNAIFGGDRATLSSVGGLLGDLIGPLAFSGFSASPTLSANPGTSSVSGLSLGGGGFSAGAGFAGSRAAGGTVTEGRPYLVGERGPEIMVPGANGAVQPRAPSGDVQVQVINNGQPLQVESTQKSVQPDGRTVIKAQVRQMMREEVNSGGLDREMAVNFGVQRQGRR